MTKKERDEVRRQAIACARRGEAELARVLYWCLGESYVPALEMCS